MTTVKTTIVVDEETWTEFKKVVSSRYGGLRKLSFAVEEAIKCFNAPELLRSFSSSTCTSFMKKKSWLQPLP